MLQLVSRTTRRSAQTLAVAAAAVALPLAAAGPAAAKAPVCPKPAHAIASVDGGYLFKKGTSLYGCTDFYGDPPKTFRLGPWSAGHSKVNFDGSTAIWTVAGPSFEGVAQDRVWAADVPAGKAWIQGVRPTLPHTTNEDTDNIVVTLKASGESVGWVTSGGAVLFGLEDPQGADVTAVGAGTTAASMPPMLGVAQGLQSPLALNGHRVFVGRWNNITPKALGQSLTLTESGEDGDECGGAADWSLTVTPVTGSPAVGALSNSYWTSTSNGCRGL